MSFVLLLNTRYLPTDSYKHHGHYPGLILVEDNPRLGTRERRLQPELQGKAQSASLCLFSSNTPFRRDLGESVRQSKRLLRH